MQPSIAGRLIKEGTIGPTTSSANSIYLLENCPDSDVEVLLQIVKIVAICRPQPNSRCSVVDIKASSAKD
jgi:hypothetical protein